MAMVKEIATFIVITEEKHMVRQMIQLFKTKNQNGERQLCKQKDMVERNVFTEEIPNANLQMSVFRIFKRKITTEKMGITKKGDRWIFFFLN